MSELPNPRGLSAKRLLSACKSRSSAAAAWASRARPHMRRIGREFDSSYSCVMADKNHGGSAQKFGGPWTIMKVEMVASYLKAFTTLLFDKPSPSRCFKRVYIDGFAGSGSFKFGAITTGFFTCDATEIAGSAQRALSVAPPFDALHFIEKRPACLKALRKMTAGDPRVTIHDGDANAAIRKLCGEIDWRRTRGVIFLDPFGASLEWQTLEIIAATKALDVWYLFPLSSIFRNAPRTFEKLTPEKRASITKILGTSDWEIEFYREPAKVGTGLFDAGERKIKRTVNVDAIETFIDLRLKTVFPAVAKPRRLLGPRNVPLFSLFFAVSNPHPAAINPALKIAAYLLGRQR
jgi:three-Cys-motif partner protein